LIFNEYKKNKLLPKISKKSAKLLATAILSVTFNFKEGYYIKDDLKAYNELKKYFNNTTDFEKKYFSEVQNYIENNLLESIKFNNESIKI
jgi:inorganic pyrophosphatase/exopolyphosphatase